MLVHLSLAREFNGRIYATGNPQECYEKGVGDAEMTLRISLGAKCGTVEQVRTFNILHFFMDLIICFLRTAVASSTTS